MKQLRLFKEQPVRSSNGRYCTREQLRVERVDGENKRLRFERDKYLRAWMAVSERVSKLERELKELKELSRK